MSSDANAAGPAEGMSESRAASFETHLQRIEAQALKANARLLEAQQRVAIAEHAAEKDADEAVAAESRAGVSHDAGVEDEGMEVLFSGCYLDEDDDEEEWWPEAILGRRVKGDRLFYKVKWRGHNMATWELDADIENRNAVADFEAAFKRKVEMPPTARRRFVPPAYHSKRLFKKGHEPPPKENAVPPPPADSLLGPGERAIWACEVEPHIWIPYEDNANSVLENAYRARQPTATVAVPGRGVVTVDLKTMMQLSGVQRRVLRTVQRSEEEERRRLQDMPLAELRRYIAGIVDFGPAHYEALSRLHEADKVRVTASSAELDSLPRLTFGEMMEQILSGAEFKAFSDECYICLEDYDGASKLVMLPACGHTFHEHCIRDYFGKYSKLCPVCKESL